MIPKIVKKDLVLTIGHAMELEGLWQSWNSLKPNEQMALASGLLEILVIFLKTKEKP